MRATFLGFTVLLATDKSAVGEQLPQPPEDCQIRETASFTSGDQEPVRIAAHPSTGRLYVLGGGGDVTEIDPRTRTKRRVLRGDDYIDQPKRQNLNIPLPVVMAITLKQLFARGRFPSPAARDQFGAGIWVLMTNLLYYRSLGSLFSIPIRLSSPVHGFAAAPLQCTYGSRPRAGSIGAECHGSSGHRGGGPSSCAR